MTPAPNATSTPSGDDERAIDQRLAHWVRQRTGSAVLAAAAGAASQAEGQGHACAVLDTLCDEQGRPLFDTDALLALRQHDWVGDGSRFSPFVLDARSRFYLWRNWQHESRLADALLERCHQRSLPVDSDALASDLDALFGNMPSDLTRWQRAAVAAVPGARFFVLTGGPGTGKTTTVVRMLLMLLRHARACGLPAQPSIALAAPTGKAAQRLAQAIAKGKGELQAQAAGADLHHLLPMIPHADARTLHRLLGYQPRDNGFARGAHNPLAEDIVVVDEASMVDLAMMRQLLEAMRPDAVLILLGDPGQLASVDAGSVLADIVAATAQNQLPAALAERLAPVLQQAPAINTAPSPLSGHVLALTHSWRAGSGLQRGIAALRDRSDPDWLDALLKHRADGELQLHHCPNPHALRTCIDRWIEQHAETLQALLQPSMDPAGALHQLRTMQLLCALREGPFGARGVNELMLRRLAARFGLDPARTWYPGRPVIISRNDYARGLFNGDVGIALQEGDGLRVWFEVSDRDGRTSLRSFSPRALPAHESAWAITIHRSQGSEYHDVAVLLPPDPDNPILTRELVYTAISRAREHAEVWTGDDVLRAALARPVKRHGGLHEKLSQPPLKP